MSGLSVTLSSTPMISVRGRSRANSLSWRMRAIEASVVRRTTPESAT